MIGHSDFLASIASTRQRELIADADRHRILSLARRYRRRTAKIAAEARHAVVSVPAVSSPRAKHA
ncbi:hypothetical protein [Tenggerimyces flavus]|uniref:Uncharacterized protein n=1 Tax=Tenggerimyces flavus TaxID=1708749 RepID=A0ABV7Y3Y4_9ACTN|nr:hypothetical protein [Tenggerimyces flavus]MBM7788489.1 hypothetical protein [Tenggerimyces flavus]